MKKCPYCFEEIQDRAVKCKHCGEWLHKKTSPTVQMQTKTSTTSHGTLSSFKFPYETGNFRLIEDRIIYKNKSYPYDDIEHLRCELDRVQHGLYIEYFSSESVKVTIFLRGGEVISDSSIKFFSGRFSSSKIFRYLHMYRFLAEKTFSQRVNLYLKQIQELGYFTYDGSRFYPSGEVITRRGTRISINDYELKQYNTFIQFVKKDPGLLEKLGKVISNIPINAAYWKSLIHSEFTIDTRTDRDIFCVLMEILYNVAL